MGPTLSEIFVTWDTWLKTHSFNAIAFYLDIAGTSRRVYFF